MLEGISRRLRLFKFLAFGNEASEGWKRKRPDGVITLRTDMIEVSPGGYQYEQAIREQDIHSE